MNQQIQTNNRATKKYHSSNSQHNQRGFSLIELSLVLALISLLMIGVVTIYKNLTGDVKDQEMSKQVSMLAQGITKLYHATGGDYANVSAETAINAGIVMSNLVHGTSIGTSWYSQDNTSLITIAEASPTTHYTVTLTNIPKAACIDLATQYLNGGALTVAANATASTTATEVVTNCSTADPATLALTFS